MVKPSLGARKEKEKGERKRKREEEGEGEGGRRKMKVMMRRKTLWRVGREESDELCFVSALGELAGVSVRFPVLEHKEEFVLDYRASVCTDPAAFKTLAAMLASLQAHPGIPSEVAILI